MPAGPTRRGRLRRVEFRGRRRRAVRAGRRRPAGRVPHRAAPDAGRRLERDALLGSRAPALRGRGRASSCSARRGPDLELGRPLADYLGAGFEPDVVFDLAIEGNRPDCLCVAGDRPRHCRPARSAAAAARACRRGGPRAGRPPATRAWRCSRPSCVIGSPPRCCIGVTNVASPALVRRRLTLAGMRPIDSVVDASNYVMLELGQPTHPYDLDRLGGHGLRVRAARTGEEIVTLDGVTRVLGTRPPRLDNPLAAADCLICDAEDHPVGIAGIMGGQSSEITPEASRVLLEVASFAPSGRREDCPLRRTANRGLGAVRARGGPARRGAGGAAFLRACCRGRQGGRRRSARLSHRACSTPTPSRTCPVESGLERSGSAPCSEPRSRTARIAELLKPLGFVATMADEPQAAESSRSRCRRSDLTSSGKSTWPRRWRGASATRSCPSRSAAPPMSVT